MAVSASTRGSGGRYRLAARSHALRPVAVDAVTIDDAFWAPRMRTNREATLPSQYRLLWETGRIDNLLRAAGNEDGDFQGRFFNDSDVYKWLEAASWAVAASPDPDPSWKR